jgi:hypothetical protein
MERIDKVSVENVDETQWRRKNVKTDGDGERGRGGT